jgi:hypothetical protein
VQSERRDKKEKDNHYPQICEKFRVSAPSSFSSSLNRSEPWARGVPRRHGDDPVEQSEEDTNNKGAQKKVSEENNFFAFHDSSVISDGAIGARLPDTTNPRELLKSVGHLWKCESAK